MVRPVWSLTLLSSKLDWSVKTPLYARRLWSRLFVKAVVDLDPPSDTKSRSRFRNSHVDNINCLKGNDPRSWHEACIDVSHEATCCNQYRSVCAGDQSGDPPVLH